MTIGRYGIEGSVLTSGDDNDTKHLFNNGGHQESEHADGSWTAELGNRNTHRDLRDTHAVVYLDTNDGGL